MIIGERSEMFVLLMEKEKARERDGEVDGDGLSVLIAAIDLTFLSSCPIFLVTQDSNLRIR